MSINYTLEMMNAVNAISGIKPDERDAKVGDLPELKNILQRRKRTLEFIRPLIVARKKAIAEDPDYQIPDDLITWILNGQDKYGEQSDEELSEIQVRLFHSYIDDQYVGGLLGGVSRDVP